MVHLAVISILSYCVMRRLIKINEKKLRNCNTKNLSEYLKKIISVRKVLGKKGRFFLADFNVSAGCARDRHEEHGDDAERQMYRDVRARQHLF